MPQHEHQAERRGEGETEGKRLRRNLAETEQIVITLAMLFSSPGLTGFVTKSGHGVPCTG